MLNPVTPLAAAVVAVAGTGAAANCAPREAIVERLAAVYAESLTARGLQTGELLLEVWASAETGTFTVLMTSTNGVSCVVAAGTDFFLEAAKAAPEGVAG